MVGPGLVRDEVRVGLGGDAEDCMEYAALGISQKQPQKNRRLGWRRKLTYTGVEKPRVAAAELIDILTHLAFKELFSVGPRYLEHGSEGLGSDPWSRCQGECAYLRYAHDRWLSGRDDDGG